MAPRHAPTGFEEKSFFCNNYKKTYQRIAYEAIRGAARAAITAMKNHRGYRTRPSTMPTGNGGRTAI